MAGSTGFVDSGHTSISILPETSLQIYVLDSSYDVTGAEIPKGRLVISLTVEAVIHFAAMDKYRSSLCHLAQALLLLVLFNSMACSIGHGQMLQRMFASNEPSRSDEAISMGHPMVMDHSRHHMSQTSKNQDMPPMHGMDSLFGDCFFAASLPLGLMLFTVLAWLLRRRQVHPVPRRLAPLSHPTALLLSLQPRAP